MGINNNPSSLKYSSQHEVLLCCCRCGLCQRPHCRGSPHWHVQQLSEGIRQELHLHRRRGSALRGLHEEPRKRGGTQLEPGQVLRDEAQQLCRSHPRRIQTTIQRIPPACWSQVGCRLCPRSHHGSPRSDGLAQDWQGHCGQEPGPVWLVLGFFHHRLRRSRQPHQERWLCI